MQVTWVIHFAILDDEQCKLEGSGSGLDSYLPELAKVIFLIWPYLNSIENFLVSWVYPEWNLLK